MALKNVQRLSNIQSWTRLEDDQGLSRKTARPQRLHPDRHLRPARAALAAHRPGDEISDAIVGAEPQAKRGEIDFSVVAASNISPLTIHCHAEAADDDAGDRSNMFRAVHAGDATKGEWPTPIPWSRQAEMSDKQQKTDVPKALATLVVLGFIGWVAWTWNDKGDASRSSPPILDFAKPLYVRAGAIACPTSEDISAIYQAAMAGRIYMPGDCGTMKKDQPVVVLESAAGSYRVRFIAFSQDAEAWVAYSSLRN